MEYQTFMLGEMMVNCYLVWSGNEAGVIDPGGPVDEIIRFLEKKELKLKWIVNTHGHVDHIIGNGELVRRYGVPIFIHHNDRMMLNSPTANLSAFLGENIISPDAAAELKDGETISLGNESLTVIETPGHTPGGICLYTKGLLFSGDTLFQESIGRTDFTGGSHQQIIASIKNCLFVLPDETSVLPGHGLSSTLGYEKGNNPFL